MELPIFQIIFFQKKSAKDNEQLSMTILDETPQTLTFDLPDYNDNVVEK